MGLLEEIVKWSEALPDWESDALRRIFEGQFTETDKEEVFQLLKENYGLVEKGSVQAKRLETVVSQSTRSVIEKIRLAKLSGVSNVNKLKDNTELEFNHGGLTIIYGDNATGKSGFGRIFRRACQARYRGSRILPNLFTHGSPSTGAAEAVFELIDSKGIVRKIPWKDDNSRPAELSQIAVFDKECERAYVTETKEVDFLPYGADILPSLARICDELKAALEDEIRSLPVLPKEVKELADGDSEAAGVLKRIDHKTDPVHISEFMELSEAEVSRLEGLEKTFAERKFKSPHKLAAEHRKKGERIRAIKEKIEGLEKEVGDSRIGELRALKSESVSLRRAAEVASKKGFSKEPVQGVGSPEWYAMFEAARKYAEEVAYPEKKFSETFSERCVLCQQELRKDAEDRLGRFEEFVKGEVARRAREKEAELVGAIGRLKELGLDVLKGEEELIDELKADYPEECEAMEALLRNARDRRAALLKSLDTDVWEAVPTLDKAAEVLVFLSECTKAFEGRAKKYEKAPKEEEDEEEKEYAKLKERRLLKKYESEIVSYIDGVKRKRKLKLAKRAVDTTRITVKEKQLLSETVTKRLHKALQEELSGLGVTTIKPKYQGSGEKGKLKHHIVMEGMRAPEGDLSDVLSEGEQSVVGIASFLAELRQADRFNVVVFDDPVSSLDHRWGGRVASRLVKLSEECQVIIFTHNILFLFDIVQEAERKGIKDHCVVQAVGAVGGAVGCVLEDEDAPIEMLNMKQRIKRLRKRNQDGRTLFKTGGVMNEGYRSFVRSSYSILRSAWERAIEEVVFGGVLMRFRKSIQTQRLRLVATNIERKDCDKIVGAMDKCSEITDAHDTPGAARAAVPNPDEFERDVKELDDFVKEIKTRSEEERVGSES